ncbi:MAG: serine hydrolase [Oscillospiraceae bacterium]
MNNKNEKLISIIIIVLSLIAFAVIACIVIFRKPADAKEIMPKIVGYSVDDVTGCYSRFFTLDVEYDYDTEYEKGVILSQSIAPEEAYIPGNTVVKVIASGGKRQEETTEAQTEAVTETDISEADEASELVQTLLVDSPKYDFETMSGGEASTIITSGIDTDNEEIKASLDDLYNVLIKKYGDAGFMYVNLQNGASVEYNADVLFSAASIIKAPYVRAVLGSETDLSQSFEMTEEMLNSSTELIGNKPVGTKFTIEELAKAAIEKSDNTAYKMLYNYIGYDCFNQLAEGLGRDERMTDENYWFKLTARETAVYFKDIYYFNQEHQNGSLMKDFLANSEHNDLFSDELEEYTVCEKYGFLPQDEFYTLGAAAVVYTDSPYVIILYIRSTSSNIKTQLFHDCARYADNLNKLIS